MTRRFIVEIDVDENKLRKEYRDGKTSLGSIILEELGWVLKSGLTPVSISESTPGIGVVCKGCGKEPKDIPSIVSFARENDITPLEFLLGEEGTYNPKTGKFYCDSCYIKAGMPLGPA